MSKRQPPHRTNERAVRCFVCSVPIHPGEGRYHLGDWVLCPACHDKHAGRPDRPQP